MSAEHEEYAPLSLFPLHSALLPGGLLALRIFETRYLDMVRDCLRSGRVFGVCLIESGTEVGAGQRIYPVGTSARIIDWDQRTDGLLGIVASGERRFRIKTQTVGRNGLLISGVEWLPEVDEPECTALPDAYRGLSELLQRLVAELGAPFTLFREEQYLQPGWIGSRLTELLPLAAPLRQALVEIDDSMVRLERIGDLLRSGRFS